MQKLGFILCLLSFLIIGQFKSQFNFDFAGSYTVKKGNDTLDMAWSGGLNFVQFSEIDYDFDGDKDLFLFDRSKDNIRLFENTIDNNKRKYKFVYNAKSFFPSDLRYRVALVDFNNDGKNDMFTYGTGGVKVFKNTGDKIRGLTWELVSDLVYSDYNGSRSNLYVSSSDIPAYVDVDFDGDIDVLTFNLSGDRLEYHQNQSQDLYQHSDSLVFVLKNECWGKFTEDLITSVVNLNSTETPCNEGNIPSAEFNLQDLKTSIEASDLLDRHAGSTVLAIDYDNSGVYDVVLGDVYLKSLTLLINGGTLPNTNSPMVSKQDNFPNNTLPVNVTDFPAAYYLDVDFDGVKDLIATPNSKGSSFNVNSIHFYKNIGTTNKPVFQFETRSFLQNEMLDIGTAAIPVFVDENGDNKEDMILAELYHFNENSERVGSLHYFANSGELSSPSFNFITDDFNNLLSEKLGLRIVPAFGDIDGDGDKDVVYGLENGSVHYAINTAGVGKKMTFDHRKPLLDIENDTIKVFYYAFPQLFDLNKDGLLDLILGQKIGRVIYYENKGTSTAPIFSLVNDSLGGIDNVLLSLGGYTAPHFFRHNDTTSLFLGGLNGKIRYFKNIDGNLEKGKLFDEVSTNFKGIDVDLFSSCWINDIDNDGNYDLFVGGDLGGVFHFEHSDSSSLSIKEKQKNEIKFVIYPNPTPAQINIELEDKVTEYEFKLYTNQGAQVYNKTFINKLSLSVEDFSNGIYHIDLIDKQRGVVVRKKVVILK